MSETLKILLLEDVLSDAELICRKIQRSGIVCATLVVDSKSSFIAALKNFSPDVILSDHTLPFFNSVEALEILAEKGIKVPFILVTGTMTEEFAVSIMKKGAWDYIPKNQMERLPEAIHKAMDKFRYEKVRQNFLYDAILNEAYMLEAERIARYGSWEIDMLNNKFKLSKEAHHILDYMPGETENLYESILSRVHPDDAVQVKQMIKNILNDADTCNYKNSFRLSDANGLTKIIKTEFVLTHNALKKLIRINGFIQDVTNLNTVEERLIESEDTFWCLAESISETTVIVLDADGCIISTNEEAQNFLGYTKDEITGMPFYALYTDVETDNGELTSHLKLSEGMGKLQRTACYQNKNGAALWADVVFTTLKNKSGDLRGCVVVMRENTGIPPSVEHPAILPGGSRRADNTVAKGRTRIIAAGLSVYTLRGLSLLWMLCKRLTRYLRLSR